MYAISDKVFFCKNVNNANDTFYATKSYLNRCGFDLKIADDANEGTLDWYDDHYTVTRADSEKYGFYDDDHEVKMLRCTYDQLFYDDSALISAKIEGLIYNGISLEEVAEDGRYYDEEEDEYPEIFYYDFIDDNTAEMLVERTDELIYYIPEMDVYVLGVTHYGTHWKGVDAKLKF